MATLPPLTDDFDDFVDVLNAAHRRREEARELDPDDACLEPPFMEFGDTWVFFVMLASVVLGIAALVVVFFDCTTSIGLLVAAVVAALVVRSRFQKNARALRTARRESVVLPGAMVQANGRLFDTDNEENLPAFYVVTFDDELESDPDELAEIARRMGAELKDAPPGSVPAEVQDIAEALTDEVPRWKRRPLPESWCGHPDTWVVDVLVEVAALPRKHIDRCLLPLLVHPTDLERSPEVLPAKFWWREDVDDLTEMLAEE